MHSDAPLVEVVDLHVHFAGHGGFLRQRREGTTAVDGVSFQIARGESLGLVGESGCGKSTTGRAVIRLREPTSGTVRFDGIDLTGLKSRELRAARHRMQLIAQDPYSSLNPRHSIRFIIRTALELAAMPAGRDVESRSVELMDTVGLSGRFLSRFPHQLSGGQRQRVAIARALAMQPDFLVCDEPVSALDVSVQAQIVNLLVRLRSEMGLTYLFVSHDLSVVRHIADRVAVMYFGRFVEVGPTRAVFESSAHPYTRALLSAVPIPDPDVESRRKRIVLRGELPSAKPPPGCRFRNRCWLYERLGRPEDCVTRDPSLVPVAGAGASVGHEVACHHSDEMSRIPGTT